MIKIICYKKSKSGLHVRVNGCTFNLTVATAQPHVNNKPTGDTNMKDFSGMGKKELRVACKEAGIKYSSLTVGGMRDALVAHHSNNNVAADVVTTDVPASINATPEVVAVAANGSSKGIKIEKDREERNGVKRPSAGGLCRAVWDFLDGVVANTGITPSIALVREEAAHAGWNPNNANIEYYQWRKFHGIRGRQPKA